MKDKINYSRLNAKVRRLIEEKIEMGFALTPGMDATVEDERFCAIGAPLVGKVGIAMLEDSANALGISKDLADSISDGFEYDKPKGFSFYERDAQGYQIGREIRRDYCEYE